MIDVSKLTRAKAERLVASTVDLSTLDMLKGHANKHVKTKAWHKINRLAELAKAPEDKPKRKRVTKVADLSETGEVVKSKRVSKKKATE